MNNRKYTQEQYDAAREMRAAGISRPEIMRRVGFKSITPIRWLEPESRKKHLVAIRRWQQEHLEQTKQIQNRASKRFYQRNRKKIIKQLRERYNSDPVYRLKVQVRARHNNKKTYWKDVEKSRARGREKYRQNKLKQNGTNTTTN